MKKTISITALLLLLGGRFYAQTVIFKYDEAGNQIFRGLCDGCKQSNEISSIPSEIKPQSLTEKVANSIRVAPVPVKTDLTILWDAKVKDYITRIELLPYNDVRVLHFADVKSLNNNSCIFHMESYSYGVYYLRFYLSDGSIYTKTITKN